MELLFLYTNCAISLLASSFSCHCLSVYQSDVALLGWALGRCYSSSSLGAHHWRKQWGDVDFGSFESSYLEVNISWFYMILLFKHVIHVHDCSPTIDIHAKDHPSKIGNDWKAGFCEHGSKDIKSKWLKRLKPTTTVTTSLASSWSTRVNPSQPESTRVNPRQPAKPSCLAVTCCDGNGQGLFLIAGSVGWGPGSCICLWSWCHRRLHGRRGPGIGKHGSSALMRSDQFMKHRWWKMYHKS